jgi:hypothetical protein
MRSIRKVACVLGGVVVLAATVTGTASASSAMSCKSPNSYTASGTSGCRVTMPAHPGTTGDAAGLAAAKRSSVIRQVCQLLSNHGIKKLQLCTVATYLKHANVGFLPYNPAGGGSPEVVLNNSIYCDPGDTATGELRNVQLASGYTYTSMQSPDNPNSIYVKVVRPPTDYDYTKPPTDADLIRFSFDFVCRDEALPAHA